MLGRVKLQGDFSLSSDLLNKPDRYLIDTCNVVSLKDMLQLITCNDLILVVDGELVYGRNVRVDWLEKKVYLPYLKSDYCSISPNLIGNQLYKNFIERGLLDKYYDDRIAYNQEVKKYVLWNKGLLVTEFHALVETEEDYRTVKISIKPQEELLLLGERETTTAESLFKKYIQCAMMQEDVDVDLYWGGLSSTEKNILNKLGLSLYKQYNPVGINPHRLYREQKLKEELGEMFEVNTNKPYAQRRIEFELEVLDRLVNKNNLWCKWTKGDINKVVSGENYYCKYKVGGISLVVFNEWFR